jgi:16S rRNA (adenine1518-N6/adenine1519-N6)-dimethyltransferase
MPAHSGKLTSPSVVRRILREHGIRPRKRWGQHFLCDENVLHRVIEAAELAPHDRAFEIGPGLGVLTQRLAERASEVVAVEIDARLIPILQEQLAGYNNVRIVQGDVLQLDWGKVLDSSGRRWKALGNLPYGITSPLLERLIEHRALFERAVWMMQLEVAEKLLAPPGTRESSSLGVFVQAHCEVERIMRVSKNSFYPRPEVDSAVVRLRCLETPRFRASREAFSRVVSAAFGMRRKTILRALTLSPQLGLSTEEVKHLLHEAGIEGRRRGETLTIEELDRLAQAFERLSRSGEGP